MLCNMRLKLIPTDHIYIHKYRNFLSVDTFLNPPHVLKQFVDCMSYTIMLKKKEILSGTPKRKRCLTVSQFCIDYCKLMADSTFL